MRVRDLAAGGVIPPMDPPDPESVEDRFHSIVAAMPPVQSTAAPPSKFVKRAKIPEVK